MTPLSKLRATLMVSTVVALSVWTDEAQASFSNEYNADVRRCFCDPLDGGTIVWIAMGRLIEKRPTPETIAFYLLVERSYGASAPTMGKEITLKRVTTSEPGGLLLLESKQRPGDPYVLGVEAGKTLRFIGTPESGWGQRWTYDEYCVERRDADAVLSFIESVDFDYLRCLDEITDALDIPKPSYLKPDHSACSADGTETLTSMALALGLLARRRGRSTGVGPQT